MRRHRNLCVLFPKLCLGILGEICLRVGAPTCTQDQMPMGNHDCTFCSFLLLQKEWAVILDKLWQDGNKQFLWQSNGDRGLVVDFAWAFVLGCKNTIGSPGCVPIQTVAMGLWPICYLNGSDHCWSHWGDSEPHSHHNKLLELPSSVEFCYVFSVALQRFGRNDFL